MLEITSAKVTATPGPSGWVQVYEFTPEDPSQLRVRGKIFIVVASKKWTGEIEAMSSGRALIKRFNEEYYGALETKTFDALKNTTQKVIGEFKESWGDVEIVCCAMADGVVYSAASGGCRVIISRDGALATILTSQGEDVIAASGYPKVNDSILLGTQAFFEKVTVEVIKTGLDNGKPEFAEETFAPLVRGSEGIGTTGALIMKFTNNDFFVQKEADQSEQPVENREDQLSKPKEHVFKEKLAGLITLFSKKIPKKGIYLKSRMGDEATSQSRKMTFSVGLILLGILIVSIGFGIRQKKVNDFKKEYQGKLAVATEQVDRAISLSSVSIDDARQLFLDSEQKLTEILALKVKDPKVDELQKKIEDSRAAILGEFAATPELFLDLGLLSSGFKGDLVSSSGGLIYVLDKGGGKVVSIAFDTKKSNVVAGPSVVSGPLDLASYQDNVYVLFSDGVYLVDSVKTKVIEKTWTGNAFIHAFAGNLYILDKDGNQIYRYSGVPGNTFGSQQNWLSGSTKPDFSGAVSWGMNGAIYVLYPNSKILKYSLGSPQNFSLSAISPEIGNVDALYADPDNQNVYLLDKAGKRVVVIDKNGKYIAQYISDQISATTSLVVSESQKRIILLTGDKLLSVELKNN
jgi:hypothetical protein